jgi:hypothetical protein
VHIYIWVHGTGIGALVAELLRTARMQQDPEILQQLAPQGAK